MAGKGSEKTWAVVKFIEDLDSVEAVPTSWIIDDDCVWPPFSGSQLQNAIKHHAPPEDSWISYKIYHFRNNIYANYSIARLKAAKAEGTSDLNSDDSSQKRKKFSKVYSSDDEESSGSTSLPSPPPLKIAKRNTIEKHIPVEDVATTSGLSSKSLPPKKQTILEKSPRVVTQVSQNVNKEMPDIIHGCSCCPLHKQGSAEQYKQLIRKINILQGMISQLSEDISSNLNHDNTLTPEDVHTSLFSKFNFPLQNSENVMEVEEFLKVTDNFEKAVQEISRTGGSTIYDFIKRVLSKLITNELAAQYSWYGLKNKMIFGKLAISQLVIDAGLKQNKQSSTRKEYEQAIKDWLRRAKERAASALRRNLQ